MFGGSIEESSDDYGSLCREGGVFGGRGNGWGWQHYIFLNPGL